MSRDKNTVDALTSAVFDNGRRGQPRPGCDCEQCFGYCLVDAEQARREGSNLGERGRGALRENRPLAFD